MLLDVTDLHDVMSARASAAWAQLAEVGVLEDLRVVVRPDSPLALPGCTGILRLCGTVTAVVPDAQLVGPARDVLQRVTALHDLDGSILAALAQDVRVAQVVAQASLFFACEAPSRPPSPSLVRGVVSDAESLLACVSPEEAGESGLGEVTSGLSMIDQGGSILAAAGYMHWPCGVAHLCVLAHPAHRGHGHAASAAADAIAHALVEGLLPQWRARPERSKALAHALGLTQLGEQISIRLQAQRTATAPTATPKSSHGTLGR
jgi:hypothetical protein